MRCSSLEEEHLIDVPKSANIGHLRDENHLIGVHLIEKGAPEEEEEEEEVGTGRHQVAPSETTGARERCYWARRHNHGWAIGRR